MVGPLRERDRGLESPDRGSQVRNGPAMLGAARRASPITSDRAIMCSSPRSRNRRSARSCGGFSWPVNIGGNEMTDPAPLLPALPDIFDGCRLEIGIRASAETRRPAASASGSLRIASAPRHRQDACARAAGRVRDCGQPVLCRRSYADERDRNGIRASPISYPTLPPRIAAAMKDAGVFGMPMPERPGYSYLLIVDGVSGKPRKAP